MTREECLLHIVKLLRDGRTVNIKVVRELFAGTPLTADEAQSEIWAAQEILERSEQMMESFEQHMLSDTPITADRANND